MPRIVREADIAWEGNVARGHGVLSAVTSGTFIGLPYSLASRIGDPDGKTSPEELLAAAHGGCFTMSLAGELTGADMPPDRLQVRCRITMDEIEGEGHRIVHSALDVRASAPGLDAGALAAAVEAADRGCPFSALLRAAGAQIDVTTALDEGGS